MLGECVETFAHEQEFEFCLARAEKLPFPNSYFDVVLCLGAFEYVHDGHAAMSEIVRVTKPEGIAITTMLNRISPYRLWQRHIYFKIKNALNRFKLSKTEVEKNQDDGEGRCESPKMTLYREAAFRKLVISAGLKIEDVVYYDFNVALQPLDIVFPEISVNLAGRLETLCRSGLKLIGSGYIVKSKKANGECTIKQRRFVGRETANRY